MNEQQPVCRRFKIRLKFVVVMLLLLSFGYCIVHVVGCFRYPATTKHFNCSMDARRLRVSIVYTLHYPKFISCAPYKTLAILHCTVLCCVCVCSVWPEYTKARRRMKAMEIAIAKHINSNQQQRQQQKIVANGRWFVSLLRSLVL